MEDARAREERGTPARAKRLERPVLRIESYDLALDLDFQNLKFAGKVIITLESEQDVILNCSDLKIARITAGNMSVGFTRKGEDLIVQTGPFSGDLEVDYAGSIQDTLVGIYRAPYDDTYLVTTQFEPAHARRMLPCVDNPKYKAEFKLSLRIDKDLDAISNMPIESVTVDGGKKTVRFQKTPRMSTYLLYVGVGHFEEIRRKVGVTDLIVASMPGKAKRGEFALDIAEEAIEFYESYFGIPYSLPKLHLISVPEFAAGAMENWGAITFRETAIEASINSSVKNRKKIADVVAHELAHQWFGDLVTMKWWNDLWLNESFATFMAPKVMDSAFPQWRAQEDFLRGETAGAMSRDSLSNTHPIEVDVRSPSEIEQIFDEISYSKGASIIRMLEEYMGADDFRKGLREYLTHYKFSNATGDDLWDSLEKASGKQVKAVMKAWIQKPGYPVVTVDLNDGRLVLTQQRFLLSGEYQKELWPIPIAIELDGQTKRLLMYEEQQTIQVEGLKSLKVNADRMSFYRVFYQGLHDLVWQAELSPLDRWGIASDALAFLLAEKMSLGDYLSLLKRYYSEEDFLPAYEVSNQLSFLSSIIPSKTSEISRQFHGSQLKILRGKADENSSMLHSVVARRLIMVDDVYAKELGSEFFDYDKVDPEMKEAVAMAYARTYGNYEEILAKYRKSSSDEERIPLLSSMMGFKEPSLVALSFGLALSSEVKRQDVLTMILAAAGNPDAREVTWIWLKTNIGRLKSLYEGTSEFSELLLSVIPIVGIGRLQEVESFFEKNMIMGAETGIKAGMEKLRVYDRLAGAH